MNEIGRAVKYLRAGGVVAFPTEAVYGLGADARNKDAVRRMFTIKGHHPARAPTLPATHGSSPMWDMFPAEKILDKQGAPHHERPR
ncbi:MAG: Sua5/YciO/YrdC/YwlC family protein [Gallionella sp.]|nr:Sua5/YciO/YrdC/YwlC family protein [Gallionella sp.]